MRIPALGLKRKQWEPFAFASPSMVLIDLGDQSSAASAQP
jgi:hypothetical protein